MLYYKFENYEEFKNLFGVQKHSNGVENRKNKILLSYIKNKELLHNTVINVNTGLGRISNMAELKKILNEEIAKDGNNNENLPYQLNLNGRTYHSSIYSTDDNNGLCEDGDAKAVRYINHETTRTYKMKAGKLYRTIVLETGLGKKLPEQVLTYLCEEFAADWQIYTMGHLPKNKLCVDKNFEKIYSSQSCVGDFQSCMVNRDYHDFYKDAVDASAAYLTNEEGRVIARCIIYNKVEDENGKIRRLAERQYSSQGSDILKRALIDALVKGKHIDGYKQVGAGCGDSRNFMDTEGNSLSGHKFRIACDLDYEDTLSYQDSFKWYDIDRHEATNYGKGDLCLDITEGSIDGNDESMYDDWHDSYVRETCLVYSKGQEYYCDVDDLSEFTWMEDLQEYHHKDDIEQCPECGNYFLRADGYSSDITDEHYDLFDCQKDAENSYKEEHWYYSDYDEEYYEDENELVSYREWNPEEGIYSEKTIYSETAKTLLLDNEFHCFDGVYYDTVDEETGLPYVYEMEIEMMAI